MAGFKGPKKVVPYNPDPVREWVRASITLLVLLVFACVTAFYLQASTRHFEADGWHQVEGAVREVFPALTSVLGTALGFYFGSQRR